MAEDKFKITWYGRCCFLIEALNKKLLFDPYDTYCNVDVGRIDADILISSSTWHDHGHIGASPKAFIITYPGMYEKDVFLISGIEALESRGSPTVIFNVKFGPFSITNFADFGTEQKTKFDNLVKTEELKILKSTNIALARPSISGDINGKYVHDEIFLDYCNPSIIIPEHYFPETFIEERVVDNQKNNFLSPNKIVREMVDKLGYKIEKVESFEKTISINDLEEKKVIEFLRLHQQVSYVR